VMPSWFLRNFFNNLFIDETPFIPGQYGCFLSAFSRTPLKWFCFPVFI
jgi:hypothetical protein